MLFWEFFNYFEYIPFKHIILTNQKLENSSKLSLQASSISGWNIFYKVLEYRLKLTLSTTSYMESNKNIFFKISLANIHKSESHKESKIKTLIFSYISTQVYASLSSKGLYKQPIKISRCTL